MIYEDSFLILLILVCSKPYLNLKYTEAATGGGSEFSNYEIELRNRVTQNDITLQVTNSKS